VAPFARRRILRCSSALLCNNVPFLSGCSQFLTYIPNFSLFCFFSPVALNFALESLVVLCR
jgi:hypothetical protein